MSVTSVELRQNLDKYLALAETEDVYITRNGVVIARLSNPNPDVTNSVSGFLECLPADTTPKDTREASISRANAVEAISGLLAGTLPLDYDAKMLREERLGKYAFDD